MAEEKKTEEVEKLPPNPIVLQKTSTKGSSLGGWRWSFMIIFSVALTFQLVKNLYGVSNAVEDRTPNTEASSVRESKETASDGNISCNSCNDCVPVAIGQTRTRVSLAETFPGYRKAIRVCHQGNTFKAFIKREGKEVEITFGPQNESSFTSEDWKEFYLVGDSGSAISICKECNN